MGRADKKYTRDYKVKEIQKSLHKKARIKKRYLKSLKEEGYSLPEKPEQRKPSHSQLKTEKHAKVDVKKEIKRERKIQQKEKREAQRKAQLLEVQKVKELQERREKRRSALTKRTRRGQPLMGPKIKDLLDKIKGNEVYAS